MLQDSTWGRKVLHLLAAVQHCGGGLIKLAMMLQEIAGTGGLEMRVVVAGLAAATARACVETPLELIKVRRQTSQLWEFAELYRGFNATWIRTSGLMCCFFVLVAQFLSHLLCFFSHFAISRWTRLYGTCLES